MRGTFRGGGGCAVSPLVRQQAEQLDCLTEAHVVGQDGSETEAAKEGDPGHPALLIGAQRAGERGRGGDRFEAVVGLAGEQVGEPAVGVHVDQREVVVGPVQAGLQRVRSAHRAGPAALQEAQCRAQVPVVEFHPLAAQPDQRDLEPGQLVQFVGVQLLIADGQVVAELDQVIQAELRVGHRSARRLPRPGGELEAEPGLAHPVRQQHAEPGAGQQRRRLPEEAERALGVHPHLGRGGGTQRPVKLGEQPGGPAQPGQQFLLRVLDPGGQPGRGCSGPDVGRRHHQARVLGGLQRELDPPVLVRRRPAVAIPGTARRAWLGSSWRDSATSARGDRLGSRWRPLIRQRPAGPARRRQRRRPARHCLRPAPARPAGSRCAPGQPGAARRGARRRAGRLAPRLPARLRPCRLRPRRLPT